MGFRDCVKILGHDLSQLRIQTALNHRISNQHKEIFDAPDGQAEVELNEVVAGFGMPAGE
jgi:hypothetical protein